MLKAFQYRLYPTKSQTRLLESTLETCRRFYNACLAERKEVYEQEQRSVSKFAQLRQVKTLKESNPHAATVHSHILQVVVADLDKAFQAFFRRVKSGEKPGYPRFKGINRFDSFGLKEYGNGFRLDGRRLKLSGIGRVAVRWHRQLEGQIKTARVIRKAGEWYVSFACQVEQPDPMPPTQSSVGVDVGVANLITLSDGTKIDNPKWYRSTQTKLRIAQRRVSRRTKGGKNRRKAVLQLQRLHLHTQNQRRDFLNKLVHGLVQANDVIVLEDLQINNMVGNRHLSKSILDSGWGYFRQRLAAKARHKWHRAGRAVLAVNPAYTSKTCSACGTVFEHLTLSDRWVECACGLLLDRDHNAALNIQRAGHVRLGITWGNSPCVPKEAAGL
jgi:putative transposase